VRDPRARPHDRSGNLIRRDHERTAVLGLGPIGPLAAKPVIWKVRQCYSRSSRASTASIIEVDERDPDKLVKSSRPRATFGGINLEDIKAPRVLSRREEASRAHEIPCSTTISHGTAITSGAAVLNGCGSWAKSIAEVKLVCSGAGAAALACLDLLVSLGLKAETSGGGLKGVVYAGRKEEMDPKQGALRQADEGTDLRRNISKRTSSSGSSAGGVLKRPWSRRMAAKPLSLRSPTEPVILPMSRRACAPTGNG